jgi:hypothetical protein
MLHDPMLNRAVTLIMLLMLAASLVWFWRYTRGPRDVPPFRPMEPDNVDYESEW